MSDAACAIHRLDDAIVDYRVSVDGHPAGEIRRRPFGTAELHLGGRGLLLRRDDTADAVRGGASRLQAALRFLAFDARYSLREGGVQRATARRRFRLGTCSDGIEARLRGPHGDAVSIQKLDGVLGDFIVHAGGTRLARIASTHGGRCFGWHGTMPDDPAAAVFALYVLHRHFGAQPTYG